MAVSTNPSVARSPPRSRVFRPLRVPAQMIFPGTFADCHGSECLDADSIETIRVFQALSEQGVTTHPVGRRVIGILLFQDAALVPLLLAVPLLVGSADARVSSEVVLLLARSAAFGGCIAALGYVVPRWLMSSVRSSPGWC